VRQLTRAARVRAHSNLCFILPLLAVHFALGVLPFGWFFIAVLGVVQVALIAAFTVALLGRHRALSRAAAASTSSNPNPLANAPLARNPKSPLRRPVSAPLSKASTWKSGDALSVVVVSDLDDDELHVRTAPLTFRQRLASRLFASSRPVENQRVVSLQFDNVSRVDTHVGTTTIVEEFDEPVL